MVQVLYQQHASHIAPALYAGVLEQQASFVEESESKGLGDIAGMAATVAGNMLRDNGAYPPSIYFVKSTFMGADSKVPMSQGFPNNAHDYEVPTKLDFPSMKATAFEMAAPLPEKNGTPPPPPPLGSLGNYYDDLMGTKYEHPGMHWTHEVKAPVRVVPPWQLSFQHYPLSGNPNVLAEGADRKPHPDDKGPSFNPLEAAEAYGNGVGGIGMELTPLYHKQALTEFTKPFPGVKGMHPEAPKVEVKYPHGINAPFPGHA